MKMRYLKHIIKRCKTDNFWLLWYRFLFLLLRKYLETKFFLKFKIKRSKIKDTLVVKNVLGSKMYLDLRFKGINRELFVNNVREPFITNIIKKTIKKGMTIVDIGANIGYYALLESKLVGDSGRVYAIEPVKENLNFLKDNIDLNSCLNVELFQKAIGDINDKKNIFLTKETNWCSMEEHPKSKTIEKRLVEVVTLDKFLENKLFPDIIRMDVEGYEEKIIKGMKNILDSNKPLKLFIELHSVFLKDNGIGLLDFLIKKGFKIKVFLHDRVPVLMGENELTKKVFNNLAKLIFGPYEFIMIDVVMDDLLKKQPFLKEGVFQVLLERK